MNKKAFTIVELAIVLVVIGIILGMAVKGRALVKAARMKADIANINKFEAAVSVYFAKHNGSLPATFGDNDDKMMPSAFTAEGLLTEKDFHLLTDEMVTWVMIKCREAPTRDKWEYDEGLGSNTQNVCITTQDPEELNEPTFAFPMELRKEISCNIEVLKDDDNRSSGLGRLYGVWGDELADTQTDIANYKDCSKYSETDFGYYAFKVF